MAIFKAAAIQMRSGTDIGRNAETFETLVREAAANGATYVQTPGNDRRAGARQGSAPRRLHLGGPRPHRLAASRLVGRARHLSCMSARPRSCAPTASSPTAPCCSGRTASASPSTTRSTCSTSISTMARAGANPLPMSRAPRPWSPTCRSRRLGFAICYDLRFPQLFRAEALAGAEVLTVPAAFTRQTGEAHWHVLLRARAIENGAWMIAAAQGGLHEDGRETYGHSLIVDPWGRIVAETGRRRAGHRLCRDRHGRVACGAQEDPQSEECARFRGGVRRFGQPPLRAAS